MWRRVGCQEGKNSSCEKHTSGTDVNVSRCYAVATTIQHLAWSHINKDTGRCLTLILLSRWLRDKQSICQCRRLRRCRFDSWAGKIPWRREWQPTPVFSPRKFHGQRSLGGSSPWVAKSWTWMSDWAHTQRITLSIHSHQLYARHMTQCFTSGKHHCS